MKILVVEDSKETAFTIRDHFKGENIVELAFTAEEAEQQLYMSSYDMVLMDITLPDRNGIELCRSLRRSGITTYIMMLTGRNTLEDKVSALNYGADDYLTKPFHLQELRARINALARRNMDIPHTGTMNAGELTIDTRTKEVRRKNEVIKLRRKEYDLLEFLMKHKGKVVTRQMILDNIWDSAYESVSNTIDVHMKYLRDRIDRPYETKLIKTVYGLGYKLESG
jgi:DNA-binding response OmpR family regulator